MRTMKREWKRIALASSALLIVVILGGMVYFERPWGAASRRVDWSSLPVVSDGRFMPLDTLARESFARVTGAETLVDPATGLAVDPATNYIELIATWRGWGHPRADQLIANDDRRSFYFHWQQVDRWDEASLLPVSDGELCSILGLADGQTRVSPAALNAARIQEESGGAALPFVVWVEPFRSRASSTLAAHERAAVELADRFAEYQELRLGLHLHVIPPTASDDGWPGWTDVALTAWDKSRDPEGQRLAVQQAFREWLAEGPGAEGASEAESKFLGAIDACQASARGKWTIARSRAEVKRRRVMPSRLAWGSTLLGLGVIIASSSLFKTRGAAQRFAALRRWRLPVAVACGVAAIIAGVAELVLRGFIANQWPLTKGHEFVGAMAVLACGGGIAAALVRGSPAWRIRLSAALLLLATTLGLLLDPAWGVFDSRIEKVSGDIGRSAWLGAHVASLAAGGALLVLAALLANLSLWRRVIVRSGRTTQVRLAVHDGDHANDRLTRQIDATLASVFAIGAAAVAVGVASGAVWSDVAWGQCFRGNPKEATAWVVLLFCGIVHIARERNWIRERGTAAAAIMAAALLVAGSIGADTARIVGRHDLLHWEGGLVAVTIALSLQAVYVIALLLIDTVRSRERSAFPIESPSLRVYSSQ